MATSREIAGRFKPGQSGNPKGNALDRHSTKHVSTWVNELLNDENFTIENFEFSGKKYKGAPMRAITITAVHQALAGDVAWAKWLTDNATKLDRILPDNSTINFNQITVEQKDKYGI